MAEDDGLISTRPNVPRTGHRDHPRLWLNRKQYRALLSFVAKVEKGKPQIVVKGKPIDRELRDIMTFLVNSFLRPGDIFKLRHWHVEVVKGDGQPYLRLNLPPSKGHGQPVITMPVAVDIYRRVKERWAKQGFDAADDYVFMPDRKNRNYAHEIVRRQFTEVLTRLDLKLDPNGDERTLYSLRHTAIMFRLLYAEDLDLLTLARACRTSVEMIDRFYAKALTAEMNRDKLHSFRRPTRYAA